MGIFGFIEDTVNEGECLLFGHDYPRGRCTNCGRLER